jgi:hypothetical protein
MNEKIRCEWCKRPLKPNFEECPYCGARICCDCWGPFGDMCITCWYLFAGEVGQVGEDEEDC